MSLRKHYVIFDSFDKILQLIMRKKNTYRVIETTSGRNKVPLVYCKYHQNTIQFLKAPHDCAQLVDEFFKSNNGKILSWN